MDKHLNTTEKCLQRRLQLLEDERDILRAALLTVMENNRMLREQLIVAGIEDPYEADEREPNLEVKAEIIH